MLKLSRKQELQLIDLGIEKVLEKMFPPKSTNKPKIEKKSGKKWSAERRKKFSQAMKKKWKKLKAEKE